MDFAHDHHLGVSVNYHRAAMMSDCNEHCRCSFFLLASTIMGSASRATFELGPASPDVA
jgi:hypothetical protein